mgnify:CR=1
FITIIVRKCAIINQIKGGYEEPIPMFRMWAYKRQMVRAVSWVSKLEY